LAWVTTNFGKPTAEKESTDGVGPEGSCHRPTLERHDGKLMERANTSAQKACLQAQSTACKFKDLEVAALSVAGGAPSQTWLKHSLGSYKKNTPILSTGHARDAGKSMFV